MGLTRSQTLGLVLSDGRGQLPILCKPKYSLSPWLVDWGSGLRARRGKPTPCRMKGPLTAHRSLSCRPGSAPMGSGGSGLPRRVSSTHPTSGAAVLKHRAQGTLENLFTHRCLGSLRSSFKRPGPGFMCSPNKLLGSQKLGFPGPPSELRESLRAHSMQQAGHQQAFQILCTCSAG